MQFNFSQSARNRFLKFSLKAVSVGFLISLSACQLETQESQEPPFPIKLGGPTENCFSPSLKSIENYFKSKASVEEIDTAFTCFSGALDMFSAYSRGAQQKDSFSTLELRTFLERYFLGDLKVSDGLLTEVMRVKQSILGGASDRLSKAEIARLIQILDVFRKEAQRLRPYISIITLSDADTQTAVDPNLLEQAISDFTFSMEAFGTLLGQSKEVYRLENLRALLVEFQGMYKGRSNWKGPDWFAEKMPMIAAGKALLIRPNGSEVAPEEWRSVFSHIGRLYGLLMRMKYAIKDKDLFYGEGLDQVEIAILESFDILTQAINVKESKVIDYAALNVLFESIETTKTYTFPIKIETIVKLLPVLLDRVFNPVEISVSRNAPKIDPRDPKSARGERRPQNGLTAVNLERIRNTLLSWVETQRTWARLERDAVKRDPKLEGKAIPLSLVRELWKGYSPIFKESWSDIKTIFDRPFTLALRTSGVVNFDPPKTLVIDRASFASVNWKQAIVRALGYGYVSDPEGLRFKGVTQDQFQSIFNDFRGLAVDLKYLEPLDEKIWKTGFTIANIFMFSSDGDDRLSFNEAVDLFVYSFSSSTIAKQVRATVQAECDHYDLDPYGIPKIAATCWREKLQKGYPTYLQDIPGWAAHTKTFSASAWDGFFENMENASRKAENPDGPLGSGEMDRAISIHQYIETLFTRWDGNQDGSLSLREAKRALYLFKSVLKNASGFKDDAEVEALYTYLLAYGEPPDRNDISQILKWLWWKSNPDVWDARIKANRYRVAQIFGALAASL